MKKLLVTEHATETNLFERKLIIIVPDDCNPDELDPDTITNAADMADVDWKYIDNDDFEIDPGVEFGTIDDADEDTPELTIELTEAEEE